MLFVDACNAAPHQKMFFFNGLGVTLNVIFESKNNNWKIYCNSLDYNSKLAQVWKTKKGFSHHSITLTFALCVTAQQQQKPIMKKPICWLKSFTRQARQIISLQSSSYKNRLLLIYRRNLCLNVTAKKNA